MPVIMFTEIGIVAPRPGDHKMDPEQFPWIIFTADMGIFFRAVEKKQSPAMAETAVVFAGEASL